MEVEEQFEAAKRGPDEFKAKQARVLDARFDRRSGRIVIQLSSRIEISFSPQDAEELERASSIGLDQIEVSPSGNGIRFPRLDVELRLPALFAGHLGSKRWMAARRELVRSRGELRPRSKKKTDGLEAKYEKKEKWGGLRAIRGGLLASSSPERGNSEVEKDGNDEGGHQKHSVIRTASPTCTHAPEIWRESDNGEKEKDPGDFEPNDSTDAPKWLQKATHTAGKASAGLVCHPAEGSTHLSRANFRVYSGLRRMQGGGLRAGRQPLPNNASSDSYSDSQGPADGLWSHPIYDGSSDAG